MRWALLAVGGLVLAAGCLHPFSVPDRHAEPTTAEPADPLALAADCLDRGDDAAAVPHLREYVRANPRAVQIRANLAELLHRLGRPADARAEFERLAADDRPVAREHQIHCHTRLMELASADGDSYREHLHRGIGLYLLVCRWDADPDRRDAVATEQTLAKAVAALRAAREDRPTDPRANLYLAAALDRLGQPAAARTARRAAVAGLPDPSLTPAERAMLDEKHFTFGQ
ncbi:MAG: tetratricopeptide repeat protein [Gemmataceae bacterium]